MRICTLENCSGKHLSRGYCAKHYTRYKRYGDPESFWPNKTDPKKRFWSKVVFTMFCWEWSAGSFSNGYGQFKVDGITVGAHVYSYKEFYGDSLPKDVFIDHRCHNKLCVNPLHLRAATNSENQQNFDSSKIKSTTGVRGVCIPTNRVKSSKPYKAGAKLNGRNNHLGYFSTLEEASQAVREFRIKYHTHNDADRL